jgi:hypothetical protein
MVELPFRARGEVAWLQVYGKRSRNCPFGLESTILDGVFMEPRKVAAARFSFAPSGFQRLMSTF